MIVVGLTGSIGMGKSNAATALRQLGIPVHDADAAVHTLLGPGGRAVAKVAEVFPQALAGNWIDRKVLGDLVFGNTPALRRLEAILHPLVRKSSREFLAAAARRHAPIAVLDIPLLYESGGEKTVDAVIVVSAPRHIQLCCTDWRSSRRNVPAVETRRPAIEGTSSMKLRRDG